MKFSNKVIIPASRKVVFAGLNDPKILKMAIPSCESLEKLSDTQFTAIVLAKIGPIKARFQGQVELSEIVVPVGYVISGKGEGGAAGFASGNAKIRLNEVSAHEAELDYEVVVDIAGKLAQIGGRMIDGVVKKLSAQFFDMFSDVVSEIDAPSETQIESVAREHKTDHTKLIVAAICVIAVVLGAHIVF